MKVRIQCLTGMILLATLGVLTIFIAPDYIEMVVGGAVTGITALAMKALGDN